MGVPGVLEHPATRNTSKAPASPIRVLQRRAEKKPIIAKNARRNSTIRRPVAGGAAIGSGTTMNALVARVKLPDEPAATELGEMAQAEFVGAPEQASETVPVNPPSPVTPMATGCDVCPLVTVKLDGVALRL